MNRRDFLRLMAAVPVAVQKNGLSLPSASKLPRWRGFNLLEKFDARRNRRFRESDFELIAGYGFDFVRLPLSYHCWADPDPERWLLLREPVLREIDQAIEFGRQHQTHVSVNFHRAPGYCVNPPHEPFSLWTNERAMEASAFHWAHFAQRYRGISNSYLSFDLINEPANVLEEDYVKVVTRLVEAIRGEDDSRLIIADGLGWGRIPVLGLADLGVAQSTRGYDPMRISHHRASWIEGADKWPEPRWPLDTDQGIWNQDRLQREYIAPWKELERKQVGVHVGEWGAYRHTPHSIALKWMKDWLQLWKEAGWGWALWNLRGSFGVLDSRRNDVKYERFRGHQLDREMLELLRAF